MLETYFARPSTLHRLRSGPIGADVDELATTLQQQGYTWDSIRGSRAIGAKTHDFISLKNQ